MECPGHMYRSQNLFNFIFEAKQSQICNLYTRLFEYKLLYETISSTIEHFTQDFNARPSSLISQKHSSSTIEFFTIGVSVRLSDRSLHREEQKNCVKNFAQWGLKPGSLDFEANALPTELGRNLFGRRFLK